MTLDLVCNVVGIIIIVVNVFVFSYLVYRPCLYDGYVCDYISDGTSHNVCLAEKHSDCHNIPSIFLGDRGFISICSIDKSVSRRMGSSCLIFHLHACYACMALWHLYQVQLRSKQQSFIEMVPDSASP